MAVDNPYEAPRAPLDAQDQTGIEEYQRIKLLSTEGRMGRVRYIGYICLFNALTYAAWVLPALLLPEGAKEAAVVLVLFMMMVWLVSFVLQMLLSVQRCHDFNVTGWVALVTLFPLVTLVFFCIPGTQGPNQWGNPPPPNTKVNIAMALLVPLLAFGGLIVGGIMKGQELIDAAERKKAAQAIDRSR